MPAVAPTEPATAPTMSYRSHKQSGKKAPVEAPTKPTKASTGFKPFSRSEFLKQEQEMLQREREQQAEAFLEDMQNSQNDDYDLTK